MPPSQRSMPGKVDTSKMLLSRGLAIVLKKSVPVPADSRNGSRKKNRRHRKEPVVVEDQRCKSCEEISDYEFGPEVFADWTKENEECYWNPCLVQSVKSLEYKGFVRPTTLLVGGTDYSLEVVRSAWGRRMLRPPSGYDIIMLGDLDPVTMNLVAQTQFAPLPEALCKVVYDLTSEGITASLPVISKRLKTSFPEIMLPSDDILYKTLGTLIRERKLYHTGSGYSVVTPDTFRLLAMSTPIERPMLLTNEEALVRLHGVATDNGTTACTQTKQDMLTAWSSAERIVEPRKQGASLGKLKRCHSLKLLRGRDKEKLSRSNSFKSTGTSPNNDFRSDIENIETVKKEKSSMFSKLFRRGRSEKNRTKSKGTSSSTQFPPRDWADPDYVLFNSRATQTLDKNDEQRIKTHIRSSSLNRNSSKERHSLHLSSTPATPRIVHRNSNRHQQPTDVYHYRSSSLSRKASSSPKRECRLSVNENSVPRVNGYHVDRHQEQLKPRPRYESPFSPFTMRDKTQSHLTASDKYCTVTNEAPNLHGNVSPYQSTDILKSAPGANKLSSFSTPIEKKDTLLGWRRPTSFTSTSTTPNSTLGNSFNSSPTRVLPRFSALPRDISHLPPTKTSPKPQTTTKIITEDFKTTETVTKTFPTNGKELRLGTTVDVEISVNNNVNPKNKKTLLTTDLDSPVKNDLLKIATTWNHSVKSNTIKASEDFKKTNTGIPKLTATTNITTSLSHGTAKDMRTNKVETTTNTVMKSSPLIKRTTAIDCSNGRDSPGKDTLCSSSPRSTLTADAKSEFFSDSPNTTAEVHLSKDDSGFSSSASTSRPMSVSPC